MSKGSSISKYLRFPLVFGGLLLLGSLGFVYRQQFMKDVEEKRRDLYREEDLEGRRQIEELKSRM